MGEKVTFVRSATGLVREYSALTALWIASCNVIGAGTFKLPATAPADYPGADVVLTFLIAFVPFLVIGAIYVYLATAFPRSGGDYVYNSRLLHPVVGMIVATTWTMARFLVMGTMAWSGVQSWTEVMYFIGLYGKDKGLVTTAAWIATNPVAVALIAAVLLITWWIAVVAPPKSFVRFMWLLWWFPLIGYLVIIGIQAGTPYRPETVQAAWDGLYGAGAYKEIIEVALKTGWKATPFTWGATSAAFSIPLFAWGIAPWHFPSMLGGEVKTPKKTFLVSILGSVLLTGFLMIALISTTFSSFGYDFISQVNWAFKPAAKALLQIQAARPLLLTSFTSALGGNVIVVLIIALTAAFSLYHVVPPMIVATSRYLFALSFDRMIPGFFSNVSERLHTPVWAVTFLCVGGWIAVFSNILYGSVPSAVAMAIATSIACICASLSFLMLPYKRPREFEALGIPKWVPWVLAVPSLCFWFWFLAVQLPLQAPLTMYITTSVMIVGILIYLFNRYYWHPKKGINTKAIFSEIPPE